MIIFAFELQLAMTQRLITHDAGKQRLRPGTFQAGKSEYLATSDVETDFVQFPADRGLRDTEGGGSGGG